MPQTGPHGTVSALGVPGGEPMVAVCDGPVVRIDPTDEILDEVVLKVTVELRVCHRGVNRFGEARVREGHAIGVGFDKDEGLNQTARDQVFRGIDDSLVTEVATGHAMDEVDHRV